MSVLCAGSALAAETVSIALTGVQIRNATNQTRSSAPATIDPANNYLLAYSDDTRVRGVGGLLGVLFPNPVTLDQVLQTFDPTANYPDTAEVANQCGTHPVVLTSEMIDRSSAVLGATITFRATIAARILVNDTAQFEVTNVTLTSSSPFLPPGYMQFTAGSVSIRRMPVPHACDALDFNHDGVYPDSGDLADFLNVFAGGVCATCGDVDFNNDCIFPDVADIEAFVRVFAGGGCTS